MYQKIMVPLDGSELAECVLPHVETIAKGYAAATVIFVRVAEPVYLHHVSDYSFSEEQQREMESAYKSAAESYLNQLVSRLKWGKVKLQSEVLTGAVAESLTDYAEKNGVDLIIIATHGRSGISRWVRGSVADRILHSAHSPVLMVRAPGAPRA